MHRVSVQQRAAFWSMVERVGVLSFRAVVQEQLWRPWVAASAYHSNTTYTLVNAPTENLRAGWVASQRKLNMALAMASYNDLLYNQPQLAEEETVLRHRAMLWLFG